MYELNSLVPNRKSNADRSFVTCSCSFIRVVLRT